MKNVIVIGAGGQTAREINIRLLSHKNVNLTVFLRDKSRLNLMVNNDRVTVFEGDANIIELLIKAMQGQDIVINTMGGLDLVEKTKNVIAAMSLQKVKRLIAINAGGIYEELPEPFNSWDRKMVGEYRVVNLETANIIERSTLDYTILRPVWLTNKLIEDVIITKKGETYIGTETSRASIGKIIEEIVQNPMLFLNENIGIAQQPI